MVYLAYKNKKLICGFKEKSMADQWEKSCQENKIVVIKSWDKTFMHMSKGE